VSRLCRTQNWLRLTIGSAYEESPALFNLFIEYTNSRIVEDPKDSLRYILAIAEVDFAQAGKFFQVVFDRGIHPNELLLELVFLLRGVYSLLMSDSSLYGKDKLMQYLIKHGADPNLEIPPRRGAWPCTILSRAALYSIPEALTFLLERGARPDESALHMVIRRQSYETQFKLDERSRYEPLTSDDRAKMVQTLLAWGSDPNAAECGLRWKASSSALRAPVLVPLQMALNCGDAVVAKVLMEAGARVDAQP